MTSSASSSSLFASASPIVVGGTIAPTEDETTTTNCDDETIFFERRKKNGRTTSFDLCEWVSKWSKKNNQTMEEKRCRKKKAGIVVKVQCQCACADFVTEENGNVGGDIDNGDVESDIVISFDNKWNPPISSSCPDTEREAMSGESCANNINKGDDVEALTCPYNYYDTSCDPAIVQLTPIVTCYCESMDYNGVINTNPTWQCESFAMEPCPETPAPSVSSAPTQTPRTLRPTQLTDPIINESRFLPPPSPSSSSCPVGPLNLFEGKSCANNIEGLTCHYEYIDDTSYDCDCKSNDNKSSGGVDVDNNTPRWECESLDLEPGPETPAPSASSAPTQAPRTRNLRR